MAGRAGGLVRHFQYSDRGASDEIRPAIPAALWQGPRVEKDNLLWCVCIGAEHLDGLQKIKGEPGRMIARLRPQNQVRCIHVD